MDSSRFDPGELSPHVLVPFAVRPLERARLLWLNERWLIEAGFDPGDSEERARFAARLVRDFAVTSTQSSPGDDTPRLFADRYGDTDGGIHGGSGRCGSKDGFIAKGVGRTPLASPHADVYHRNGFMSLGEALREAVSGEILGRELPWGAVPVVAIIDAGFEFKYGPNGESRRAAIAVRPSFVRPAHFERSIYFGSGGHPQSEQFLDALRVREAIRAVCGDAARYPTILEMFSRFAQQLGAARALRLWLGRFLTSNISIDGAVVDFGAFRTVPNWRRILGVAGENFGAEFMQLRHGFLSVAAYFGKYCPQSLEHVDVRAYLRGLEEVEQRSFIGTCLQELGTNDREVAQAILAYYRRQQARVIGVDVAAQCHWIHEALSGRRGPQDAPPGPELDAERALIDALERAGARQDSVAVTRARALHFFRPRTRLIYDTADKAARRIERLAVANAEAAARIVSAYVDRQLGKGLNHTRFLPEHLAPLSATCGAHSAVIRCRRRDGTRAIWVEAARRDDRLFISGQSIPLDSLEEPPASLRRHRAGFELPAEHWCAGALSIGSRVLSVAEPAG